MDGIAATWVYENIKSTEVTAHNVYESVKAVLVSTGPGSENSPKACVFKNRQKHVYFKLKQYAPDMRTSLCLFSFSPLACHFLFVFTVSLETNYRHLFWGYNSFTFSVWKCSCFVQSYGAVLVSPYAGYFFSLEIESMIGHHQSIL